METSSAASGFGDAVSIGFRSGSLQVSQSSGATSEWSSQGLSSSCCGSGASMFAGRSSLPPTGMVEGAFQIGDLWVDGNRGRGVEKGMTWAEATSYCQALGLRLPTYDEMYKILEYIQDNSSGMSSLLPDNQKFEYYLSNNTTQYYYWTSTPRSADASYVWAAFTHPVRLGFEGMAADDNEIAARCVKRDGELPPAPDPGPDVEHPDDLPVGTTFRVLVYNAGDVPQRSLPVAQNTYKVADAAGTIVSTAVDERGTAVDGDTSEIVLRRGAYDFYYFSPAVPANVGMINPGWYNDLTNGVDYMALVQRQVIDPSLGSKHYIPEVCFYRMGSYIDVRISPRAGEIMGTLEVTGDGLQLLGMPVQGSYEIGAYPYRLSVWGDGGMVEFAPEAFAAEENKTATVSTLGVGGGRVVLPGYVGELKVTVTLASDGKEMKLKASLADHIFEPGYRYIVELGVGRIADKPVLDVEILPWNEYAWGDGTIGGDRLYPGQLRDGGVVFWVDPDDKSNYRVVALDEAPSGMMWGAVKEWDLGSEARLDTRNGAAVWKLAKSSSELKLNGESGVFAADYPAFDYCYNYQGPNGTDAKGTWYLPSRQELLDLGGVRETVESVITTNGGTAFITDQWYWTATEIYAVNTWKQKYKEQGYTNDHGWRTDQCLVRCIRDKRGETAPYCFGATDAPETIPTGGGSYNVTLSGILPAGGVEVRVVSGSTTFDTGEATKSGEPVVLAVPANTTGGARTVTFEYKWNGTWVKIGSEHSQAFGSISVGDMYGGGVVYWVNPGNPDDFRVVHFDESSLVWSYHDDNVIGSEAQDETARNGASIAKMVKNYYDNMSYDSDFASAFPAFSYCYNITMCNGEACEEGTWYLPSYQELADLLSVAEAIGQDLTENGGYPIFADSYFWSATENGRGYNGLANWGQLNGDYSWEIWPANKTSPATVRCIRSK